jgi:quercetin dioxygenase-like cupin family protein
MTDPYEFLKTFINKGETYAIPATGYNRHLLEEGNDCEVYVIVWSAGAETPFHGHPEGGCWMLVVSGQLLETTATTRSLGPGDTGFQKGANGIHKITAIENSISLHLYKPGLLKP